MKTGTKEWADETINLCQGKCPNNCIYCYQHSNINRLKLNPEYRVNIDQLCKKFKKKDHVIMYPSAHDIDFQHIKEHVSFLKNLLSVGNSVLIVSKPNYGSIETLTYELQPYRSLVEFRFTIGSHRSEILKFYEPDAPDFAERIKCLTTAFFSGYKTSLSIEPMLDTYPEGVIERVMDYVTGDIWVGKMNHAKARITLNGHADKWNRVKELVAWQSDDQNILKLVERLSRYSQIKWKDSIKKVIEKCN